MKIVIITNKLGNMDGWERYSQGLTEALVHNTSEVVVICQEKNFDIPYLQFPILPAPLSLKKNYFLSWYYALKICWSLRRNDFEIIHCFVESYSLISFFVSLFKKKKYFITVHGTFAIKLFSNLIYGKMQAFVYRHSRMIFSVSRYTSERLSFFMKNLPIKVIPNGISEKFIMDASRINNIVNRTGILSVGEIKSRKGFEYLIRAVYVVKKTIPSITCTIVGSQKDKDYFSLLLRLIKELDLETAVIFLKNISDENLCKLYASSRVFMLPSISENSNFEGFGLVYVEANAFGLPAIGSKESGAEDAILDEKTGFLVKQRDFEQLAVKILELLENEKKWKEFSGNAVEWSREMTWKKIALRYKSAYQFSE